MNRFRIVADSSCDLLTPDGAYFVSVPLTIRTDTEEFRDDAFLDVNEMVTVLRGTGGAFLQCMSEYRRLGRCLR